MCCRTSDFDTSQMNKLDSARRKTDQIIRGFSATYMSDATWVRLLDLLVEAFELFESCRLKLVWDSVLRDLLLDEYADYNFDYYDHAMEAMISGYPKGWYDYKEIEWLEIIAADENVSQLRARLNAIGRFELERVPGGLRLYVYR